MPSSFGSQTLIALPLALPMGWAESPPYFSVLTKTACDLANTALRTSPLPSWLKQEHQLEAAAHKPPANAAPHHAKQSLGPPSTLNTQGCPPVASVVVYVDNFLLLAQTQAQLR